MYVQWCVRPPICTSTCACACGPLGSVKWHAGVSELVCLCAWVYGWTLNCCW